MDSNRRGFLLSLMAAPLVPPAMALLADPKTFAPTLDKAVEREVLAIHVRADFPFRHFYEHFMRVTMGDLILYGPGVARENAERRLLAYERTLTDVGPPVIYKPGDDWEPEKFDYAPGRVIPVSQEPVFISPALLSLPQPKLYRVAGAGLL